jgi:hypothetical protein
MKRLHYEYAFERFLIRHQVPHLAVDQVRRPVFSGARVKNFDFLVRAADGSTYLVDVKGKLFPYRYGRRRIYWENWIQDQDILGLRDWEAALEDTEGLLVFAYHLTDPWEAARFAHTFAWRDRLYAFACVRLSDYRRYSRRRSENWRALNIPRDIFRTLAHPPEDVLLDEHHAWSPAFEDSLTV